MASATAKSVRTSSAIPVMEMVPAGNRPDGVAFIISSDWPVETTVSGGIGEIIPVFKFPRALPPVRF